MDIWEKQCDMRFKALLHRFGIKPDYVCLKITDQEPIEEAGDVDPVDYYIGLTEKDPPTKAEQATLQEKWGKLQALLNSVEQYVGEPGEPGETTSCPSRAESLPKLANRLGKALKLAPKETERGIG